MENGIEVLEVVGTYVRNVEAIFHFNGHASCGLQLENKLPESNQREQTATDSFVLLHATMMAIPEARIFSSRVTSGTFRAIAVAAMMRSGMSGTVPRAISCN